MPKKPKKVEATEPKPTLGGGIPSSAIKKPEKSLETKLLAIYKKLHPGNYHTIEYLMDKTGATREEIALTWHRLFDEGKVATPQFMKPV